jgi:hypothetical protein
MTLLIDFREDLDPSLLLCNIAFRIFDKNFSRKPYQPPPTTLPYNSTPFNNNIDEKRLKNFTDVQKINAEKQKQNYMLMKVKWDLFIFRLEISDSHETQIFIWDVLC